ncbi:MAG: hypothetical protein PGN13_12040 [Patulibacter minatonensis]
MPTVEAPAASPSPTRGSALLLAAWRDAGQPLELRLPGGAGEAGGDDQRFWRQSLRELGGKPGRPRIQIDGAPSAELMLVAGGSRA